MEKQKDREELRKAIVVYMNEFEDQQMDTRIITRRLNEYIARFPNDSFINEQVHRYNIEKDRRNKYGI